MTRCWLALVDEPREDATASAPVVGEDGRPAGHLAAWLRPSKPVRHALRADPRLIDPAGGPACVSLVLAPEGARLPFDDVAVQHARRRVLAEPPPDALSTLLRDSSHFEGAITARRGPMALAALRDDPFARVFPARLLHVGPGLLAVRPAPAGPAIERYGSANPWPWDVYAA